MKKIIVLVSVMVFSVAFFSGCKKSDSKDKKCGDLFDKAVDCVKDAKMALGKELANKDKFITECKANWKEAQELFKMECKDLVDVFGQEEEKKPAEGDMPADMPAADMPAEPAPADMPAEPAPADMPAEPAPAEDMK